MVVHTCDRCKKEFNKKSNYLQHLSKKSQCIIKADIANNGAKLTNILEKTADLDKNSDTECEHCKNTYSSIYKLKRHLNTCKVKLNNELINKNNELNNKLLQLEQEINVLKTSKKSSKSTKTIMTNSNNTTNNNTNTNCNNTTNNQNININIANFGTLDHKKIDNKVFFNSLIKYSGLTPLLKFIEYVHKNDKLPEYKNVEITDLARNLGKFIENKEWKIDDANEIVNKVIDETYNYYEVKFDELEEEIDKKPQNEKTKIKRNKRFINTMRGNEHFEQNEDGDFVDDDGQYVTIKDFQEGRKFEDKLKKKVKCSLKK